MRVPLTQVRRTFSNTVPAERREATWTREREARALEGYPMIPEHGKDVPWGEFHVGHVSIFTAAWFMQVSRPTLRRAVLRIDF